MPTTRHLALLIINLINFVIFVHSRQLYVDPSGSDDFNATCIQQQPCRSISHAINQANDHDEILLASGKRHAHAEGVIISMRLNINSENPLVRAVVDGMNTRVCGFELHGGWYAWDNIRFENFKGGVMDCGGKSEVIVVNGEFVGNEGSAVRVREGSSAVFMSGVFRENMGVDGGGVEVTGGKFECSQCELIGNVASGSGGGECELGCVCGCLMVCCFTAIAVRDASLELQYTLISDNEAGLNGGGVSLSSAAHAKMTLTTFRSNVARGIGGGLHLLNTTVDLESSSILENTADIAGGLFGRHITLTMDETKVYKNSADTRAGAFVCERSVFTSQRNSYEIHDNQAPIDHNGECTGCDMCFCFPVPPFDAKSFDAKENVRLSNSGLWSYNTGLEMHAVCGRTLW